MIDLLSLGTITSNFGYRESPGGIGSTDHKGIDIVLKDKNIPSVVAGTVVSSGYNSGMGYYVVINDENGYKQTYMHMASQSSLKAGDKVKEGQTIGKEGSTGASTGSHLHFQVQDSSGKYYNPVNWLKGATGSPSDSDNDSDSGLMGWKNTAKEIGKNISVVIFIMVLIVIMFLTFTKSFGMDII